MEWVRKPFQGVWNIVRFNWHFYLIAVVVLLLISAAVFMLPEPFNLLAGIAGFGIGVSVFISLAASYYVYDLSGLYTLNWLNKLELLALQNIVNIHAGFDETSALLAAKYPEAELHVFDFYNPATHTEVSIKRARKSYPLYPGTHKIGTSSLLMPDNTADAIFVIFAAHEIRDQNERIVFFRELKRVLKPGGRIIVTEHLRDLANFMVYNIGFLHFFSRATWLSTFIESGFKISKEIKITPFISTFVLEKH